MNPLLRSLRLLAEVRWRTLRNEMRRGQKRAELAVAMLMTFFGSLVALVTGLLFLAGSYVPVARRGRFEVIALFLWCIFAVWQLVPVLLEGASPSVNFRELARYPLTFSTYAALHLIYGLLDPAALLTLFWLAMVWLGLVLARPALLAPATAAAVAFVGFNLFLNRVIFAFFERIMSTRRGRERFLVIVFLVSILLQVVIYGGMGQRMEKAGVSAGFKRAAVAVQNASPPGLAFRAMTTPAPGALVGLGGLAAWVLLLAPFMLRQVRRNYLGEIQPEVVRRAGAVQARPGWELPWTSGATAAVIEKELRYALRNPQVTMNTASVLVFCALLLFSPGLSRVLSQGLHIGRSATLYPMLVGYAMLTTTQLINNCFGSDGQGFHRWLMAPANLELILAAKNAAMAALMAFMALALSVLCGFSMALPPALIAQVLLGAAYGALLLLSAGNWFSVRFPKHVDPGRLSNRNVSEVAILLGLVTYGVISGSLWVLVFTSRRVGSWLLPLGLLVLLGCAVLVYRRSLRGAAAYLAGHTAEMMEELK